MKLLQRGHKKTPTLFSIPIDTNLSTIVVCPTGNFALSNNEPLLTMNILYIIPFGHLPPQTASKFLVNMDSPPLIMHHRSTCAIVLGFFSSCFGFGSITITFFGLATMFGVDTESEKLPALLLLLFLICILIIKHLGEELRREHLWKSL